MTIWLRFLLVMVRAYTGYRLQLTGDASILRCRVLPNDLDINLHLTNSRYLALMDLGRLDLLVRCGLLRRTMAQHWSPVIAGLRISYRRSIAPLQAYRLETRLLGWTEYVMVMQQKFLIGPPEDEEVAAEAQVRALFLCGGRKLPVREVLALVGVSRPSPPLAADVAVWAERPVRHVRDARELEGETERS